MPVLPGHVRVVAGRDPVADPARPGRRHHRAGAAGRLARASRPSTASPPPPAPRPSGGRRCSRSGDVWPRLPLEQVTLGGEPVDQAILDRLREVVPDRADLLDLRLAARSAPRSRCTTAGPASRVAWLDRETRADRSCRRRRRTGIVAPRTAAGRDRGRVRTGDRVEIVDDRVLITGRLRHRRDQRRRLARCPPAWCATCCWPTPPWPGPRVTGRKAPARRPWSSPRSSSTPTPRRTEADLMALVRRRACPTTRVPRRIRLLDEIPMKETLKSDV